MFPKAKILMVLMLSIGSHATQESIEVRHEIIHIKAIMDPDFEEL
jgi:hypothetical protein